MFSHVCDGQVEIIQNESKAIIRLVVTAVLLVNAD